MVRPRSAFTILELLVAVTILAVLATLAVAAVTPARLTAQRNSVRADFARLVALCESYKGNAKRYPLTLSVVSDAYRDPWGTPYQYLTRPVLDPAKHAAVVTSRFWDNPELRFTAVALVSAGPDKRFGTVDDLNNWKD